MGVKTFQILHEKEGERSRACHPRIANSPVVRVLASNVKDPGSSPCAKSGRVGS